MLRMAKILKKKRPYFLFGEKKHMRFLFHDSFGKKNGWSHFEKPWTHHVTITFVGPKVLHASIPCPSTWRWSPQLPAYRPFRQKFKNRWKNVRWKHHLFEGNDMEWLFFSFYSYLFLLVSRVPFFKQKTAGSFFSAQQSAVETSQPCHTSHDGDEKGRRLRRHGQTLQRSSGHLVPLTRPLSFSSLS